MKILCVFGRYNYGDPTRGLSPEYAAFVPALTRLGHEVHHFESWDRRNYPHLGALNEALLNEVERIRPDVMLTVQMHYELWSETLEAIRARGDVATISWTTDDSWKYREVSRFIGHAYHAMTTTYSYVVPRYHADGIPDVLLTQWAASSEWLAEPLAARDCQYQATFIGTANRDRRELVARLYSRGVEVACFGYGWPAGPLSSDEIPRIMRESEISINFAASKGENQIKARTFEVPGAGGFLLTGPAQGLERFFAPGVEIAVYQSFDDLVDRIQFYLSHPDERDRLARAGHARVVQEHTYERRLAEVIDFALAAKERNKAKSPTRSFAQVLKTHRLTPSLRVLRAVLTSAGKVFFGPKRGPRAARRLVFELSWRLAGRHTFTAAGWPGRMFPHE
jgi:spore maturation protein CgeB